MKEFKSLRNVDDTFYQLGSSVKENHYNFSGNVDELIQVVGVEQTIESSTVPTVVVENENELLKIEDSEIKNKLKISDDALVKTLLIEDTKINELDIRNCKEVILKECEIDSLIVDGEIAELEIYGSEIDELISDTPVFKIEINGTDIEKLEIENSVNLLMDGCDIESDVNISQIVSSALIENTEINGNLAVDLSNNIVISSVKTAGEVKCDFCETVFIDDVELEALKGKVVNQFIVKDAEIEDVAVVLINDFCLSSCEIENDFIIAGTIQTTLNDTVFESNVVVAGTKVLAVSGITVKQVCTINGVLKDLHISGSNFVLGLFILASMGKTLLDGESIIFRLDMTLVVDLKMEEVDLIAPCIKVDPRGAPPFPAGIPHAFRMVLDTEFEDVSAMGVGTICYIGRPPSSSGLSRIDTLLFPI